MQRKLDLVECTLLAEHNQPNNNYKKLNGTTLQIARHKRYYSPRQPLIVANMSRSHNKSDNKPQNLIAMKTVRKQIETRTPETLLINPFQYFIYFFMF